MVAVTEIGRGKISNDAGCEHDNRKWHAEEKQRDKSGDSQSPCELALQRSPADPQQGFYNEHEDRAFEAEEESVDHGHSAGESTKMKPAARPPLTPCMSQPR
jgi:hypothetical protein